MDNQTERTVEIKWKLTEESANGNMKSLSGSQKGAFGKPRLKLRSLECAHILEP